VSDKTDYTIPVHRRDARADELGNRNPPGPDRGAGRAAAMADRLARIFAEIETTLRAQQLI